MTMKEAHEYLGHTNENTTRMTAKSMGWTLTGKFPVCEACAVSKARQKNMPKEVKNPVKKPGEMLCFDISSPNAKTLGGRHFWLMVTDAATKHKWSFFLRNKSDLSKTMIPFLVDLIRRGYDIKQLWCNNAGENKALMNEIKNKNGESILNSQHQIHLNRMVLLNVLLLPFMVKHKP